MIAHALDTLSTFLFHRVLQIFAHYLPQKKTNIDECIFNCVSPTVRNRCVIIADTGTANTTVDAHESQPNPVLNLMSGLCMSI